MPETYTITFGPNGEVNAASNNFKIDSLGGVTLNSISATGDDIPINADLRFQAGVGPVIESPNETKYRIKVDNDGNIGTENA